MPKDLHELPKLRDSISYLYIEHAVIEQDDSSIIVIREDGKIPIPVAMSTCLLLGPGTSITHAAVKAAAENGCLIAWCGEQAARFYASGMGETRSAENLLLQAKLCMDPAAHLAVVRRMYEIRFPAVKINPTHVGMNRPRWTATGPRSDKPHARGDEPRVYSSYAGNEA